MGALGRLFRGATAFPPGKGVWRDDTKGRTFKMDLQKNLPELRTFLHRFGREANQGEVGLIISGDYYGISEYDEG